MAAGSKAGMISVVVIVMAISAVLLYRSQSLSAQNRVYRAKIEQLTEQYAEAVDRSSQIEELKDYTDSNEYVEKTAREKFGYVYPDEVIFKPEN